MRQHPSTPAAAAATGATGGEGKEGRGPAEGNATRGHPLHENISSSLIYFLGEDIFKEGPWVHVALNPNLNLKVFKIEDLRCIYR